MAGDFFGSACLDAVMRKVRPTLADVGRAAGVSPGAVSLILREGGRFSAETRARVKRQARELGYRPDPILASYRTGKFKRRSASQAVPLAYISGVPEGGSGRRDGLRMARERAEALGYTLSSYPLDQSTTPRRLGDVLFARGVRGILLGPLYGVRELPDLGWERFACVCTPRPFFKVPFDVVRHRLVEPVCDAFEEVMRRGYRRIGFDVQIHRSWGSYHPDDRERHAAALYCREQLPKRHRIPIHAGRASESSGFQEWLRRHEPEAVISTMQSRRVLIEQAGFRVPGSVAFVGVALQPGAGARDTGYLVAPDLDRARAVEILDDHVRRNLIGPRATPMEHLPFLCWNEGCTCPFRPDGSGSASR